MGKKVPNTFTARLQKRFRADSDGPVEAMGCLCLKEKLGFSDRVFEDELNSQSETTVIPENDRSTKMWGGWPPKMERTYLLEN